MLFVGGCAGVGCLPMGITATSSCLQDFVVEFDFVICQTSKFITPVCVTTGVVLRCLIAHLDKNRIER